jgi:hypothetical protein
VGAGAVGLGLDAARERRRPSSMTWTQTRPPTLGDVSEEMSDDSEDFVPKAVTGTAHGKTSTHMLYLVKWDDFPNSIDFMREPRANFDEHAALADAFVTAWRAAGKPWPPAPAR